MSNAFVKIKMCYVYNQWYDICVSLCISNVKIFQAATFHIYKEIIVLIML